MFSNALNIKVPRNLILIASETAERTGVSTVSIRFAMTAPAIHYPVS
jgi:hypothetical protein